MCLYLEILFCTKDNIVFLVVVDDYIYYFCLIFCIFNKGFSYLDFYFILFGPFLARSYGPFFFCHICLFVCYFSCVYRKLTIF